MDVSSGDGKIIVLAEDTITHSQSEVEMTYDTAIKFAVLLIHEVSKRLPPDTRELHLQEPLLRILSPIIEFGNNTDGNVTVAFQPPEWRPIILEISQEKAKRIAEGILQVIASIPFDNKTVN